MVSDFLYSAADRGSGWLTRVLASRSAMSHPGEYLEFRGRWGALCVKKNHYEGFDPLETDSHVMAVLDGPLLYLKPDVATSPSTRNTQRLLHGWQVERSIVWHADVSGPFVAICIHKLTGRVELVTDMLGFIPAFLSGEPDSTGSLVIGTHLDAVAEAANCQARLDFPSLFEFIVAGVPSFPFTAYKGIRQAPPAAVTTIDPVSSNFQVCHYWTPTEESRVPDIRDAAVCLREEFLRSVRLTCEHLSSVAIFMSGGEDSRAVLAAVPREIKRVCITVADDYNREASLAEHCAREVGAEWILVKRAHDEYIQDFDTKSRVLSLHEGNDCFHMFAVAKGSHLDRYDAVLGGLLADALFKGYFAPVRMYTYRGVPIWPSRFLAPSPATILDHMKAFLDRYSGVARPEVIAEILDRRSAQFERVRRLRPNSAAEWRYMWPFAQSGEYLPYFQGNRRMFRSREPFGAAALVKLAASLPMHWKLDRRIYHLGMGSVLGSLGWLPHSQCYLPRLGFWPNVPIALAVGLSRRLRALVRSEALGHNVWPDFNQLVSTPRFENYVTACQDVFGCIQPIFLKEYHSLFDPQVLTPSRQLRLLQILVSLRQDRGPQNCT